MAITNLTDVVDFLGITTTDYDDQITKLIPLVEADYLRIRCIDFDTDENGIVYPDGADVTAAMMIGFRLNSLRGGLKHMGKEISSESIDNYSVSYRDEVTIGGYPLSIVSSIERFISGA